jgi:hypothetical protein
MTVADERLRRRQLFLLAVCIQGFCATPAWAFPPYKTTDADTADPYTLELRLGLLQATRGGGETEYASPLLRANFGLPNKFELISEFEYLPDEGEFGEGAVGFKWAPLQGTPSFGIETLALLPVREGDSGVGVESQLVATWHEPGERLRVHVNAGGFHDPRGSDTDNGWRASALTELTGLRSFRPGIELFAKRVSGEDADVRLGVGVIKDVGAFEIRSALHAGLTNEAPDVVFSLWLSVKIPFR